MSYLDTEDINELLGVPLSPNSLYIQQEFHGMPGLDVVPMDVVSVPLPPSNPEPIPESPNIMEMQNEQVYVYHQTKGQIPVDTYPSPSSSPQPIQSTITPQLPSSSSPSEIHLENADKWVFSLDDYNAASPESNNPSPGPVQDEFRPVDPYFGKQFIYVSNTQLADLAPFEISPIARQRAQSTAMRALVVRMRYNDVLPDKMSGHIELDFPAAIVTDPEYLSDYETILIAFDAELTQYIQNGATLNFDATKQGNSSYPRAYPMFITGCLIGILGKINKSHSRIRLRFVGVHFDAILTNPRDNTQFDDAQALGQLASDLIMIRCFNFTWNLQGLCNVDCSIEVDNMDVYASPTQPSNLWYPTPRGRCIEYIAKGYVTIGDGVVVPESRIRHYKSTAVFDGLCKADWSICRRFVLELIPSGMIFTRLKNVHANAILDEQYLEPLKNVLFVFHSTCQQNMLQDFALRALYTHFIRKPDRMLADLPPDSNKAAPKPGAPRMAPPLLRTVGTMSLIIGDIIRKHSKSLGLLSLTTAPPEQFFQRETGAIHMAYRLEDEYYTRCMLYGYIFLLRAVISGVIDTPMYSGIFEFGPIPVTFDLIRRQLGSRETAPASKYVIASSSANDGFIVKVDAEAPDIDQIGVENASFFTRFLTISRHAEDPMIQLMPKEWPIFINAFLDELRGKYFNFAHTIRMGLTYSNRSGKGSVLYYDIDAELEKIHARYPTVQLTQMPYMTPTTIGLGSMHTLAQENERVFVNAHCAFRRRTAPAVQSIFNAISSLYKK